MKVGDVVLLRSGGPRMTVANVTTRPADGGQELCRCLYFTDNRYGELLVPAEALEIAEKKDEG